MRRHRPEAVILRFAPEEPRAVVAEMDRLGTAHAGWINFFPEPLEDEEPDAPDGLGGLFSASGPEIPVCTWTAGKVGDRESIGIEHASGTKAVTRLANLAVPVPEGWRWQQDHPKRGLVIRPPLDTSHSEQLHWLLEAGRALSRVRLTGQWEARVRTGR
jgi:hypothetical protein